MTGAAQGSEPATLVGASLTPTPTSPRISSSPAHPPWTRTEGITIARIDDLMERVESKFHLVHLAAKRAREINGYYAQLGEGLGQYVPPLLSTESNKPLTIALEEIAQGKVEGIRPSETVTEEDPLAFIEDEDGDEPA